jgi:hypothetical protein
MGCENNTQKKKLGPQNNLEFLGFFNLQKTLSLLSIFSLELSQKLLCSPHTIRIEENLL